MGHKDENLVTVANALELGATIVERVMGGDVSATVDGEIFTLKDIQQSLSARIQTNALRGVER